MLKYEFFGCQFSNEQNRKEKKTQIQIMNFLDAGFQTNLTEKDMDSNSHVILFVARTRTCYVLETMQLKWFATCMSCVETMQFKWFATCMPCVETMQFKWFSTCMPCVKQQGKYKLHVSHPTNIPGLQINAKA